MRAAELFDPSRGLRFSTYAVVWIKGTLFNSHLSEFVRLPQREKAKYNKILKAQRDMDSDVAAVPSSQSPERVAQATGLSVEEVVTTQERMHQAQRLMSLDYEYATLSRSGADSSKMSMLEKNPSLQADVDLSERTQLQADVLAALARNLDAREARLMRLRYGLSDGHARSLHECADAMGLSYTRVHQLANKCLEKLRRASEVEALEEYLLTIA
jgi:RNA polymerase primary sigma factor